MNSDQPVLTLSVVIPTRHRPDLLARCLDALAPGQQTLATKRYEVITSDDGEPGRTMEAFVRERYSWVRWMPGPCRGSPGANRNSGVRAARGKWLAFTDDDCIPEPGWLESFVVGLEDGARVCEGRITAGNHVLSNLAVAPVNETGGFLWSSSFAIERALFEEIGGFDENFPLHLEDVDLRLRLADCGIVPRWTPEATVLHPPRPPRPIFQQARDMEASFYLARKRGIPVSEAGLSVHLFVRTRLSGLLESRSVREALIVACRNTVETLLLLFWWLPRWLWHYRHPGPVRPLGKKVAEAGNPAPSARTVGGGRDHL